LYQDQNGAYVGATPQVASIENIESSDVNDLDSGDSSSAENFVSDLSYPYPYRYTFIEPNYGQTFLGTYTDGTSQHPMDGVSGGEGLIKKVYEAIRNSPLWETSLLIVTYDEHGGFYDHVVPPRVPAESEYPHVNGFAFDRLGPRVPAVIVSPWVQKGVVDHGPNTGATIDPNVHYEHATIVATLRELASVGRGKIAPLTTRDNVACTITHLLQGTKRAAADCPEQIGDDE
jgi:phospholipase C